MPDFIDESGFMPDELPELPELPEGVFIIQSTPLGASIPGFGKYILKGKQPIREFDLLKWAMWFETADRRVCETILGTLNGEIRVSTVFLGLDHNFSGSGRPVLFETMIFGGQHNNEMVRTSTWAKAEAAHKYMIEVAKETNYDRRR